MYHGSVMYSYSKDFLWNLMSFSYRIVTCFIVTSVMHNIASSHMGIIGLFRPIVIGKYS